MRRLIFLILAMVMLFSGCSWMDGEYVSVTPHPIHGQADISAELKASNIQQLQAALAELISAGREKGVIFVGGYDPAQVEMGIASAVDYTMTMTPLGAYAVESISYELGNSGGKPAIALEITYRRSLTELRGIRKVANMEAVSGELQEALKRYDAALVLEVIQFESVDIAQLVEDYAQMFPQYVMEVPQVAVGVYPETGDTRILELKFTYQNSRETLRHMREQVTGMFGAAEHYVGTGGYDGFKLSRLYAFLAGLYRERETSMTPAYSLLQHGVGDDRALATVYAAMCRQVGLECFVVTGSRNGEPRYWVIAQDGGSYCHVDLLRCMEQGGFRRFTDGEMSGYVWDYSAYPACPAIQTPPEEDPTQDPTDPEMPPQESVPGESTEPGEENFE